jgi:hypothetical protein
MSEENIPKERLEGIQKELKEKTEEADRLLERQQYLRSEIMKLSAIEEFIIKDYKLQKEKKEKENE